MIGLRRHALVRLSRVPAADNDRDRALAERWQAAGRPFVVTRGGADPKGVGLGFCVVDARHPELRPRRVAARCARGDVAVVQRPPRLDEIARCPAAAALAGSFSRLVDAAREAGLDIRVYGSWMWQALTGENHVRDSSDLDVLIDVADAGDADRVAAFLERQEDGLAFRIDGELSIAGLGEVHWRELRQDGADVLVKSIDTLRLTPRAELRA
ncbi:MAG: malonate decarboxylase holo-[acyl-carrier-protein] synthase [Reyranella sp.]|nr:malonate decarboxylase holo-[acyl-carrier-protein] synthase [Reyranella sp.]MBL6653252.1 malonate decarboxylase holo-[acyl-carrier-protein] synthase [Reyranella sp.]